MKVQRPWLDDALSPSRCNTNYTRLQSLALRGSAAAHQLKTFPEHYVVLRCDAKKGTANYISIVNKVTEWKVKVVYAKDERILLSVMKVMMHGGVIHSSQKLCQQNRSTPCKKKKK